MNAAIYSSVGLLTGITAGAMVESAMPMVGNVLVIDGEEFLTLLLEVTAQITLNGLITAGVVQLMGSMPNPYKDPTAGMGYLYGLFTSQPSLDEKVRALARTVQESVSALEYTNNENAIGGSSVTPYSNRHLRSGRHGEPATNYWSGRRI